MYFRYMIGFFAIALFTLSVRADAVFVKNREKAIFGTVKFEDGKGITVAVLVKGKKVDEQIPAADLIDIHYDDITPAELRLAGGAYRDARDYDRVAMETTDPVKRRVAANNAIARYTAALAKMAPHKYAIRTIEFRIASLLARQADLEGTSSAKALASLQSYKKKFPTSWQMNHVMPKIALIQMAEKDYKGAEETYREIADLETLPIDVRHDAELMVIQVNLKAGKADLATKKLDELEAKAKNNPGFHSRVIMTRAELLVGQKKMNQAIPLLQNVIKTNKDRTVKAMAHNTLGECLFNDGKYGEALWEFLWVDTVFNEDKHQRAKALYFLWKCFEQTNNAERAQECREMLVSEAQFAGTQYQALAIASGKTK